MIQFNHYKVSVDNHFLFEVENFSIEKGNVYYLIGKNGVGKSTFLKSIINFEDKTEGIIIDRILKQKLKQKELAQKIAYVPSKVTLNNFTSVEDFLLMGRYPYGSPFSGFNVEDKKRLEDVIQLLEINDIRFKFMHQLSDGQQQLISIGRALVQEVDYLLLDEPTAFLDYYNKKRIFNLVEELSREKKMGIAIVSHDIDYLLKQSKCIFYVDSSTKKLLLLEQPFATNFENIIEKIYQ